MKASPSSYLLLLTLMFLSYSSTCWIRRPSIIRRCWPTAAVIRSASDANFQQQQQHHSLEERFHQSLFQTILPSIVRKDEPKRVLFLLGVSGGCDSVGLFHLLRNTVNNNKNNLYSTIVLHVVHFDHQQRGSDSDGDRIFVQTLCDNYNIPITCYYWQQEAEFSQEAARRWRQSQTEQLLQDIVMRQQETSTTTTLGICLTAHHKDDSEETLLLKLLRGAHLTHLQGMDPVWRSDQGRVMWARPLLGMRKSELQQYLQHNNYEWREDDSNQSNKYRRNLVRNELIPLLTQLVGSSHSLEKRLENISQQSRELGADLTQRAQVYLDATVTGDDGHYFAVPDNHALGIVQKQALYMWIQQQSNAFVAYDDIQRVCEQLVKFPHNWQWTINIGDGWDIVRKGNVLELQRTQRPESDATTQTLVLRELSWTLGTTTNASKSSLEVWIPRDRLPSSLRFHLSSVAAIPQALFTPPWRTSPIRVKEFLRGQKVPLHQRLDSPVIVLDYGGDGTTVVVAVYTNTREEWVVDQDFAEQNTNLEHITIDLE